MNNTAQHFVSAFLLQHLCGQDHSATLAPFDATTTAIQPYGFTATGAIGLRLQAGRAG
jgi:hypothetical protein